MNTIIIGNGPSAIKSKNREFIDSVETIIRINNFKLCGFEQFIGTKTDIWAVNVGYLFRPDIIWNHPTKQPRTIIFSGYSITEYENYQDCQKIKLNEHEELCDINVSKQSDCYYNKYNKTWLSTGMLCIMQFAPCYILGFDNFLSRSHHYGDSDNFFIHHNGIVEKRLITQMINDGRVKII